MIYNMIEILKRFVRGLDSNQMHILEELFNDHRLKMYGMRKVPPEERQEYINLFNNETEWCCECGSDYPRYELVLDNQIYCKECRT